MKALTLIIVALLAATAAVSGSATKDAVSAEQVNLDQKLEQARAALAARAGEQINWQVVSSGGGKGSSASFVLQATVAQTAVGDGSSASFNLHHGYWQDFSAGGTCCMGDIRGNIDYDVTDAIDISDLVYLVDYMFTGGSAPVCWEEANVDGSGDGPPDGPEDIDISDLVYLVDYMFTGGPEPVPCP